MDKWEDASTRIKQAILAEEPDAALTAGLDLFAEFGRTVEQMSADLDRIATALEAGAAPPKIKVGDEAPVHDL